ncbi:uncharacterized protein isoform X2 [Musca autumnalis]|uniref:uncharacterized protein isoform X2 n=1 Tax=Musca autumnalis TaxID=221902 RepID=UPI003CECEDA3
MEIVYDKSVIVIPKHLSFDFFEEVLENSLHHTNGQIQKIIVNMGSKAGDNYCSFIYRVEIKYKERSDTSQDCSFDLPVIIKSTPASPSTDFLDDMEVFLKEKIFYYHVLPLMENLMDKKTRIFHSVRRPVNTFVFEDLNALGYKLASREKGLDETHALMVLRRLAQFHSNSVAVMKKDPTLLTCFKNGILATAAIRKEKSKFYGFIKSSCEGLIDLAKTWNGYKEIVQKMEKYSANLQEHLLKMQQPFPGEFEVLNHGDLWVNNVMFKYDVKCAPSDMVFLDYQMSIWGSPGIDLNYFFYTSLSPDLLKSKREFFIRFYYNELKTNLSKLQFAADVIPSYEELRKQITRREPFGFFANHAIYPIISIDEKLAGDSTFENFANPEFARRKFKQIFSQQKLQKMYAYTLLHFNEMKVFDKGGIL